MYVYRFSKRIIEQFRNYLQIIYRRFVGFIIDRHTIWPNATTNREAMVETENDAESRKIFVMMHSGRLTDLYSLCFKTARDYSPYAKIELYTDFTELEKTRLIPFGVTFHDIKTKDFERKKTALKVEPLQNLDFRYGDKVIISDIDVIFQSDPFTVFENDFDVFFTTRHYRYHYVINSGIWGFRVNEMSNAFAKFYIRQMFTKDWCLLRKFREKFGRDPYGFDILMDQDFLCTVYENIENLPEEISGVRFFDAGYKYNFCPSYDIYGQVAIEELRSKIGNTDYKVLHLKGELKSLVEFSDKDILNIGH